MYTFSVSLPAVPTARPVLTLLLSGRVLPPLISLAIQFFSYMYICMDPPHSNPTCAQTFSYCGGAHGRQAAELAKLAQRRLKKTHLGRGELRTTSQSCL